jgi:DNA-directed RNA polymerase specialized sigma24 family protein
MLATRWTRIGALNGKDAEQEWQWFVGRYRPFVRGILGGVLGRAAQADAAEEEFWGYVWLSGALQRADRDRRFRAFLSGIVRNFALGWGRQRGMPIADTVALAALPVQCSNAEFDLWVDNVLTNALATLRAESPTMARALACFYGLPPDGAPGQPKSASEVAAALDNTPQGVYMLLFRGRRRMRQLIQAELREGCRDDDAWREEMQQLLSVAASKLPGLVGDST